MLMCYMDKLIKKYPDRVPVYIQKKQGDDIPELKNRKYLVPRDMTIGQFMIIIRKKVTLDSKKALFIFTDNNTLPPNSETFGNLHKENARPNGILYTTFAVENTFGC